MGELFACLLESTQGLVRGDLVAGDHPMVVQHPQAFTRWSPPPVETRDGTRTTEAFVVVESFARIDRTYLHGDAIGRKDPAVRAVRRCVTRWTPPTVHTSAPQTPRRNR